MEGWPVVFLILGFILLTIFGLKRLKKLREQTFAEVKEQLGEENILAIDPKAIFYGIKSKGYLQGRQLGGCFALTKEKIFFKLFQAYGGLKEPIEIQIKDIVKLSITDHFMSGSSRVIGGLLVIHFTKETGEEDELGLRLEEKDQVKEKIESMLE